MFRKKLFLFTWCVVPFFLWAFSFFLLLFFVVIISSSSHDHGFDFRFISLGYKELIQLFVILTLKMFPLLPQSFHWCHSKNWILFFLMSLHCCHFPYYIWWPDTWTACIFTYFSSPIYLPSDLYVKLQHTNAGTGTSNVA